MSQGDPGQEGQGSLSGIFQLTVWKPGRVGRLDSPLEKLEAERSQPLRNDGFEAHGALRMHSPPWVLRAGLG